MTLELNISNYTSHRVAQVIPVRHGYGYRIYLKYADGKEKSFQKSGFKTEREANKHREKTIAELYQGTFIVYPNVKVAEYLEYWLEEDLKKRTDSYETYYNYGGIIRNHIVPVLGKKKMADVSRADVHQLFKAVTDRSRSVAKLVKTIMNVAFRYAVAKKVIGVNPAEGVALPRKHTIQQTGDYRSRGLDEAKTLTLEQVMLLIDKSKDTPIHMQVLFNVLMGLRRSEINGLKYSDVDYINRTLKVERQLGTVLGSKKEDYAPKTFTKQEVGLKTASSYRELPIPDLVFEAILQEKEKYERNRRRRANGASNTFFDLGYICCSSYGRPRSKNFHWKHYKRLLADNHLPDIRWHDLRSTYCTLLLKESFNPKAVSKLMGHAKEIITVDVYGDGKNIIADGVPEMEAYMQEVIEPANIGEETECEALEFVPDISEFLADES